MKTTKKTMIATLIIVMVLTIGVTPIFAQSENTPDITPGEGKGRQTQANKLQMYRQRLRKRISQIHPEEIDLSSLDEADVAPRIADALKAEEIEDEENAVGGLWILNARGSTVTFTPITDAELSENRIGLQLVAENIKNTKLGALYEIHWGRVLHDDEKVEIEGYALLDSDGVFYLTLDGEDLEFKAIGKIAPAMAGVRVAMKGYMIHDDIEYSHKIHGRAIPFGWFNRAANQLRKQVRPTPNMEDAPVEPTHYNAVTSQGTPA